jgi:hypothetical protein
VIVELVLAIVAALGVTFGAAAWLLARRWARDCRECRIIIGRKGKVVLDAPLTEWLAWNRALPTRERSRGGIIFHDRGIQVALARPKIPAAGSATQETRTIKTPPARASSSSSSGAAA